MVNAYCHVFDNLSKLFDSVFYKEYNILCLQGDKMNYTFLLELAIILFSTKLLGIMMRKIGLPQVVGALLAGILIGPFVLKVVSPSDTLSVIAEIGVIMIMFSAGLETSVKDIKETGKVSLVVAAMGVILPLIGGFVIGALFNGGFKGMDKMAVLHNVFIGVVLTATSVSITVETLREMGKLKSKAGTTILSAAIIDDIIGIVILSIIIGINSDKSPWTSILMTVLFFVFVIVTGVMLHLLFKYMARKFPQHRRVPIFAFVACLVYAYLAERVFGVADITGAYLAGIMFSGLNGTDYIEKKIDINAYMIFAPVFFANIGIKADFSTINSTIILFALCFVAMGIFAKMGGCYLGSRLMGESNKDSLIIGIGMIARGEVALIVMQKGIDSGLVESKYLAMAVLLVIITSFLAPILLRLLYRKNMDLDVVPISEPSTQRLV